MDEVASAYSIRSGFDGALMAEKKGKGMVKADAEDVRTRPAMRIGVDSIIFSWSKDYRHEDSKAALCEGRELPKMEVAKWRARMEAIIGLQ